MILNKISNNQISYKSQPSAGKKGNDSWAYFTGLITLPTGGYLGWKNCKDKFEKEHKILLNEQAQELEKTTALLPEQKLCNDKLKDGLQKLDEFAPKYNKAFQELEDMNIPESKFRAELQDACINKIIRFNNNSPTEMPNCIMFINPEKGLSKQLINCIL